MSAAFLLMHRTDCYPSNSQLQAYRTEFRFIPMVRSNSQVSRQDGPLCREDCRARISFNSIWTTKISTVSSLTLLHRSCWDNSFWMMDALCRQIRTSMLQSSNWKLENRKE